MVFTNTNLLGDGKSVINIPDVEGVQVATFLGVIVDEKLTWIYHRAHINGKVNECIYISVIYKVKKA